MKFIRDITVMVTGVSKTHWNNGKRRDGRNCKGKKNCRKLYFYDEDGLFHTKTLTFWQAVFYKITTRKVKRKYDK